MVGVRRSFCAVCSAQSSRPKGDPRSMQSLIFFVSLSPGKISTRPSQFSGSSTGPSEIVRPSLVIPFRIAKLLQGQSEELFTRPARKGLLSM